MKRIYQRFSLLAVLMLTSILTYAYDFEVDGIGYNQLTDNTCEVTCHGKLYNSYTGVVDIPGNVTFDGVKYTVTRIGKGAFSYCTEVTKVTIPNTVEELDSFAFESCEGLSEINFPSSVRTIGYGACYGCSGISTLVIPNTVTKIDKYAFRKCFGLKSVTLSNKMTCIEDYAFANCSNLTSITIPSSVTSIRNNAFYRCLSLTSFTLPKNVTDIEDCILEECTGLKSLDVEAGNPVYDSRDNCNAIIETASNMLIKGCDNTVIPSSVKAIRRFAFNYCKGLKSVVIPDGVTSIESTTFQMCKSLTSITIPNSVTSIGTFAFNLSGLTSITLPAELTSIQSYAFQSCYNLTSITIPSSVTTIEDCAFSNSGLSSVTNLSKTPQTLDNYTFYQIPFRDPSAKATLHVLPGCKAIYEAADHWKDFNIVEDAVEPAGIENIEIGETENRSFYDIYGRRLAAPLKGLYIKNGKKYLMK